MIVFVMEGCPACEDYKPRLAQQVAAFQGHGQPFVWYQPGMPLMPGQIPVIVLDADSEDDSVVSLADQYGVEGLPTTLLLRRTAPPAKLEGAVDDRSIYEALASACLANR